MMMSATVFLVFSLMTFDAALSGAKSINVSPCKEYSKDFNQCCLNALESLRPRVSEGIPNFKIPPLDPFSVREMLLNKTTDAVDLKAVMTQLYLTGVSNVQFSKLNVNLKNLTGMVSLSYADLNVTTLYDLEALIIKIIPMKGQGKFNGFFKNVKVDVMVEADRSSKNKRGNSYLKVEKIKLKVFIGGANGRLVNTNKNVRSENFAKTANSFLQKKTRLVLDVLTPMLEEFAATIVLDMVNQILTTMPYENMFVE